MSVIYVLLPVALALAAAALWAFIHAVRSGQYDDLDSPAVRMLLDDDGNEEPGKAPGKGPGKAMGKATSRDRSGDAGQSARRTPDRGPPPERGP